MATTIVIHRPPHRRRALELQTERRAAEAAYDANIGAYLDHLREEARAAGFLRIEDDERDWDTIFSIDETDHSAKKAAYAWLEQQPDIWNWMP